MIRTFLLRAKIGLLGVLIALMAGPSLALPPLWTVRDGDSELVIFGSVHILPADLDWRPAALDVALARADDVWFELPIDPATQSRVAQLALEKGLLPRGVSLNQLLSPADRARLERLSIRAGIRPEQLQRFRPWLAEASLAVADFRRQGAWAQEGVEQVLSASLPATAQRRAFETPEQQIDFLSKANEAQQVASLVETLRQMDETPSLYNDLIAAWLRADLIGLDRQALGPIRAKTPGLYRTLIRDRNRRWVGVIEQRLAGQGRSVMIVGVGHLLGKDGLPERLRRLGYLVEGP